MHPPPGPDGAPGTADRSLTHHEPAAERVSAWWGLLDGLVVQLALSGAAWWGTDDGEPGLSVAELGSWAPVAGGWAVVSLVVGLAAARSWRWRRFGLALIAGTYLGAAVFSSLVLPYL